MMPCLMSPIQEEEEEVGPAKLCSCQLAHCIVDGGRQAFFLARPFLSWVEGQQEEEGAVVEANQEPKRSQACAWQVDLGTLK